MIEQRVNGTAVKGWRGIALIAAVAAAAIAGSCAFTALEPRLGSASGILFLFYGALIAWFLLNRYVLSFVYTCKNGCLRISRAYGKRERFMLDVWLNSVKSFGDPEDVRRRFPSAKIRRAVRGACPIKPMAVAYTENGRYAILILQPDEALRGAIVGALKK